MIKAQKPNNPPKINDNFINKKHFYDHNLKGPEIIKFIAKNLPSKPGVYQMENEEGAILYIGKAKNLAKRVINYSSYLNLTKRLQRMVSQTKNISFTVTNTEVEALLLECNLIKRYKPKFNIILRDDKSFPYILINKDHKFSRIQKYRGSKNIKGDYYGPFVSPSIADHTLMSLQKTFLLRSCSDNIFANRLRPCLLYDIKRCSAPCVNKISHTNYRESINDAKKFLSGNTNLIKKKLIKMMKIASKNQSYEDAARLRDRIKSITQIQKYQSVYIKELKNIDIFGIKILNGRSCVYGMFYRNGSNYGNKAFFPYHDENSNEIEILESFLFQFYSDKEPPPKILVNVESQNFKNVAKILSNKNKIVVKIICPKKGAKHKHISLAEKNSLESIKIKNTSLSAHRESLERLKNMLNLNQLPKRIEVYDNSHIFGNQSLGVMIVVNQEGFETKSYRKFNIKFNELNIQKSKSNDFYMLSEVLKRRLLKGNDDVQWIKPDIIIVDGGKGHLNIAKKLIKDTNNYNIELIAIAKGKDRNRGREIIYYKNLFKLLKKNDVLLNFLQRIRDEAHRFAINAHRLKRSKESIKSIIDEIQGVGKTRKTNLLKHFGNLQNIKNANIDELHKVKGINKNLAKYIYGFFHSY